MKNILSKISMVLGYLLLWMSVSGLYEFLLEKESMGNILASLSLVFPLGFIFRWFSQAGMHKQERLLRIINDILSMFLVRGVIGVMSHMMLPSDYIRYISDSLLYGAIFILTGAIGLYFVSKVHRKEVTQ